MIPTSILSKPGLLVFLLCTAPLALTAQAQVAPQPDKPPMPPPGAEGERPPGPPRGMPPGVPAGTPAPDGIGVTVGPAPSAANIDEGGFGPWVDISVVSPLQAGDTIPENSIVYSTDGQQFDLGAAIAKQPTLLIFYRGGWCPYCNAHLRDLQGSAKDLRDMGYQILAVSSDTPAQLQELIADASIDYTLLSDSTLEVAAQFGLRYKVVDHYLDHVKNDRGRDLREQNGGYLLTPGAFVVDSSGGIRFAYVNNNFAVRISQDALLAAARSALE